MCTRVRIELAKLILVGTRITYQATGDAGYAVPFIMQYFLDSKMDPSRFFSYYTETIGITHDTRYR